MNSKKFIVILNGYPRSGKDTFADAGINEYLFKKLAAGNTTAFEKGIKLSSVDKVKQAAHLLGWDGEKDENSRQFLADLKTLSTKHFNHPFNYVTSTIEIENPDLVFLMLREPEEIQKIVDFYKSSCYNVKVIKIIGKNQIDNLTNSADSSVNSYEGYTDVFLNYKSKEEWEETAKKFTKSLFKAEKKTFSEKFYSILNKVGIQ